MNSYIWIHPPKKFNAFVSSLETNQNKKNVILYINLHISKKRVI